ncbi:MAG TPA: HAD-IA family hydrolase [Candidatus Saccharimonadales bacterium]
MIRAVIFDCFGVLAGEDWLPFKQRHFGHDQRLNDVASDLRSQVDAGLKPPSEFIAEIARMADVPEVEVRKSVEGNAPNKALFDYIEQYLKPHYKIGMLSNAGGDRLHELFTPDQVDLFDAVALSYETGVVKPNPQAYRIIAERLGVLTGACVLVDDQERYCAAARAAGMQAVVFETFAQMRPDLEKILAK